MKRRDFITLLGGAAIAWPHAARAQQPARTYRLGIVVPVGRDEPAIIAFLDELRIYGFIEGQNLQIVPGGFLVRNEQISELVPAMVQAAPDVILSGGDLITRAFQKATQTIPLVVITEDMIAAGFAASLARPGGNITGISLMSPDLDGKRQDILIEAAPGARRIAALEDSNVASLRHIQALSDAAKAHGMELLVMRAAKGDDLVPVEGLPSYVETAFGDPGAHAWVEENGVRFKVSLVAGQKTGWFYDQSANRRAFLRYVGGRRVLDVFSYLGAWGLAAARAGASEVVCVDSSAPALALLEESAVDLAELAHEPHLSVHGPHELLHRGARIAGLALACERASRSRCSCTRR